MNVEKTHDLVRRQPFSALGIFELVHLRNRKPPLMHRRHLDTVSLVLFWRNPQTRRMGMAGHQFVNADCSRFTPANAVNQSQYGDTQWARANESNTTIPASARKPRSTVMRGFPF
jgi:hypothetical protein